jgi:hypothetical protein
MRPSKCRRSEDVLVKAEIGFDLFNDIDLCNLSATAGS